MASLRDALPETSRYGDRDAGRDGGREDWPRDMTPPSGGFLGISTGWALTGVALVGLGLLAWNYFGPDLKRYLKIRNM